MTASKLATPLESLVTVESEFFPMGRGKTPLFRVNSGVPLTEAIDGMQVLLGAAQSSIECLAMAADDADMQGALWPAAHLLGMVMSLTDAIHGGIRQGVAK